MIQEGNNNFIFTDKEKMWLQMFEDKTEEEIVKVVESCLDDELYHEFSSLRSGVLQWYDFGDKANVLEIGSGYGTITGLLCDKCAYVTAFEMNPKKAYILKQRYSKRNNLNVVTEDMSNLEKQTFDYIIFNGSLGYQCGGSKDTDDYVCYLNSLKSMLSNDGRIIIVTENRLGVSYLCGKPAPASGLPFDTLSGFPKNSKYYTFTKRELRDIAINSEYQSYRFYYPLPDHLYAQEIYSEDYLPTKKVEERILQRYCYNHSAIADERKLLREFIENNAFDVVANSYILELGIKSISDVLYATVTLDRGLENASATVIHKDYVQKSSVASQGYKSVRNVFLNANCLKDRGVPVIEHNMHGNTIRMPRVKEETLSSYLGSHCFRESDELFAIFDKLQHWIIRSSDTTDVCHMKLEDGVKPGLILKKAYIDMVPFNCFISRNGEFKFFDQEFVFDNYPAGFVMYRALMYTYLFSPQLEDVVSIDDMKKRYDLSELWSTYEKEEQSFVAGNRRYDVNRCFWDKTYLPFETIERTKKLKFTTAGEGYVRMKQLEEKGLTSSEKKEYEYELGYIAGVFDLFHVGHLNLLEKAKAKCKRLLVGALTDELVMHFKGKKPYIPLEERMRILESNKNVDGVVAVDFSNIDKLDAWKLYRFDCLFSGDDWKDAPHWQKDKERLQAVGSNIHFFEYTKSTSSTQIKETINRDKSK